MDQTKTQKEVLGKGTDGSDIPVSVGEGTWVVVDVI